MGFLRHGEQAGKAGERGTMSDKGILSEGKKESIFLSERFAAAACILTVAAGLVAMVLSITAQDGFAVFEVLVKLVTAASMYLAFRFFKWDVAKGLMGGVLFCLMYQEAHLVLARLWSEQNFDVYLVAGVQGSLYIAASGMSALMTVIITINHFFINYGSRGNPKDVIVNRIALIFKFGVYILLFISNSGLGFSPAVLWRNGMQYLSDTALLLMLVCIESQFDSFKILRSELKELKQKGGKRK